MKLHTVLLCHAKTSESMDTLLCKSFMRCVTMCWHSDRHLPLWGFSCWNFYTSNKDGHRDMHWANNKGHQIRCPKTSNSCWSRLPSIYNREGGEHGSFSDSKWEEALNSIPTLMAGTMPPSATAGKKFPFAEVWLWCPLPLLCALTRLLLTCLVCVNNTFCLQPWSK